MARRKRRGVRGRWSKEEVKRLKKLFRNAKSSDVAAKLGRSVASMQSKASELGLRKTKKHLKSIGKA